MATHNMATVYSPDRSDELLGGGWAWSTRHIEKVTHEKDGVSMKVRNGVVWFRVLHTNHGARKLQWTEDYPYSKMIMLTFFQDIVEEIARSIINETSVESFNTE